MPPVSREVVIEAVKEYGEAWVTQDPKRIGKLFTEAAVYVERAFDRKATFRGRDAIEKYWRYQICGKQNDISFRHVTSEMVRDADQPIAVVKWLAEFNNHRENRADKAKKRVQFCQMAKLIFEGTRIKYLEEYAQGMSGAAVRWPGVDATDDELWRRIRFDPPKPPPPVACENCEEIFGSRTKLFAHLRATDFGPDGQCIPIGETTTRDVLVCLSLSYPSSDDVDQKFRRVFRKLNCEVGAITWAVPTTLSASAIVNVATVKLPETFLEDVPIALLATTLNRELTESEEHITIHTSGIVSRPCAPERRDFEKYAVLVPWKLLRPEDLNTDGSQLAEYKQIEAVSEAEKESQPTKPWRRRIEDTKASEFADASMARRVKHGARLMRDYGNSSNGDKLRIRTSTMEEPFHRFCRISISLQSKSPGCIDRVLRLLISYARSDIRDDEFLAILQSQSAQAGDGQPSFPLECVILVEPWITKFEGKMKLNLCRDTMGTSDSVKTSIDEAETLILNQMARNESLLEEWARHLTIPVT